MHTKAEYMPYINVALRDLGIPESFKFRITFETDKQMNGLGGQVISWIGLKRQLHMRINAELSHVRTLEVILHELKHVEQRYNGRLRDLRNGVVLWYNTPMNIIVTNSDEVSSSEEYYNQPWEVEARTYEDARVRLFPGNKRLGRASDGTRFFKVTNRW